MPHKSEEFIRFAQSVAANESDYAAWQQFAETSYEDEAIEEARLRIVDICTVDDSLGNPLWPLTEEASEEIRQVARTLLKELEL
ncbi:MAG: hypothetical protein QNJ07_02315 [Woeseiaceae bacterium]|nr:hypothetical protein [Woeseiaceae bacterium]